MGHSYDRVCYHIVFATKYRDACITKGIEREVWRIVERICQEIGIHVHAIGGWDDHLHLAVSIPPKVAVADAVREVKSRSTREIRVSTPYLRDFAWQVGYSVFTFRCDDAPTVIAYINNQRAHHE